MRDRPARDDGYRRPPDWPAELLRSFTRPGGRGEEGGEHSLCDGGSRNRARWCASSLVVLGKSLEARHWRVPCDFDTKHDQVAASVRECLPFLPAELLEKHTRAFPT